jgi:hypothetical protein
MPALQPVATMKQWRVALVAGLAIVLVFGHAYDMLTLREHWPFSFYPMYGRSQKRPQLQVLSLYLVTPLTKTKTNKWRLLSGEYVPPLSEPRMRNILMASWGRDGTAPKALKDTARILADFLRMYESRRVMGLHTGPPIVEAQLCRVTWRVKQGATSQKPRAIDPLIGVRTNGMKIIYDPLHRGSSTQPLELKFDDDEPTD